MDRVLSIAQAMNQIRAAARVSWFRLFVLFLVCLGVAVAEALSLGLLYPALAYLEKGPDHYLSAMPAVVRTVVGWLNGAGITVGLGILLLLTIGPVVARLALQLSRDAQVLFIIHQSVSRLRITVFDKILHAKMDFHRDNPAARIHMAMLNQIGSSARLIPEMSMVLASAIQIGLFFAILVFVSPLMAILGTGLLGVLGLSYRYFYRAGARLAKDNLDGYVRFKARTIETIQNARLIKIYGMERLTLSAFDADLDRAFSTDFKINFYNSCVEGVTAFLFAVASIAIFYVGAVKYDISLAALGLFMIVMMRVQPAVTAVGRSIFTISTGLEGWRLTTALLAEAEIAREQYSGPQQFEGLKRALEFRNVNFGYQVGPKKVPALVDLSISIRAGQIVGLVGKSGAGKSTLIDLIARFIEPQAGDVTFDGVKAAEFDLRSLRRGIGFVPQEPLMFDDTIRMNLTYGIDREVTEAELVAALEAAHALDILSDARGGLEARIGDRGVRLSGGQRQRIALARAILARKSVLILDEPTNALDVETELGVRDALQALAGKATILIIAHRLETVQIADRILVLRDGRIIDDGSHEELRSRNAFYRELFNLTPSEMAPSMSSPTEANLVRN